MRNILKLFLPVLFPAWNFFDIIAPSPRIEYTLLDTPDDTALQWHSFRPPALSMSIWLKLRCFFWNQRWNETLYMISCAERLLISPSSHCENQISQRILKEIMGHADNDSCEKSYFQFRLLVVSRRINQLQKQVVYYSKICTVKNQE